MTVRLAVQPPPAAAPSCALSESTEACAGRGGTQVVPRWYLACGRVRPRAAAPMSIPLCRPAGGAMAEAARCCCCMLLATASASVCLEAPTDQSLDPRRAPRASASRWSPVVTPCHMAPSRCRCKPAPPVCRRGNDQSRQCVASRPPGHALAVAVIARRHGGPPRDNASQCVPRRPRRATASRRKGSAILVRARPWRGA